MPKNRYVTSVILCAILFSAGGYYVGTKNQRHQALVLVRTLRNSQIAKMERAEGESQEIL